MLDRECVGAGALTYDQSGHVGERTSVAMLSGPRAEVIPPKWLPQVLHRCCDMLRLETNWDTYGAQPVRAEIVSAAIDMLGLLMKPATPAPQVVATPAGGLQFEWHQKNQHLELEFVSPHKVVALYETGGSRWEREFTSDLTELVKVFHQL